MAKLGLPDGEAGLAVEAVVLGNGGPASGAEARICSLDPLREGIIHLLECDLIILMGILTIEIAGLGKASHVGTITPSSRRTRALIGPLGGLRGPVRRPRGNLTWEHQIWLGRLYGAPRGPYGDFLVKVLQESHGVRGLVDQRHSNSRRER